MNTDDSDFMVQRQGVSVSWYDWRRQVLLKD